MIQSDLDSKETGKVKIENQNYQSLIIAIQKNKVESVISLMELANISQIDSDGLSPKDWVVKLNLTHLFKFFNIKPKVSLTYVGVDGRSEELTVESCENKFGFQLIENNIFESPNILKKTMRGYRNLFQRDLFSNNYKKYMYKYRDKLEEYDSKRKTDQVEVRYINAKIGYGVLVRKDIEADQIIGEYIGQICNLKSFKKQGLYSMEYPISNLVGVKSSIIEATSFGNYTRFINHAFGEQANLRLVAVFDGALFRILLVTLRSISSGEEIRYNYGGRYWEERGLQPLP